MPLTILHKDGQSQPTIICDECGEPIVRHQDGCYAFADGADGATVPLMFFHLGARLSCLDRYERRNGASLGWMHIEVLFPYLLNNLEMSDEALAEARQRAVSMSAL